MSNFIVVVVLMLVVGAAIAYIVKEKKKGTVCIGCPNAGVCTSKNNHSSGCNCN